MKYFYLIVLLSFCASVSSAQYVRFQARVDEFWSGAEPDGWPLEAEHTWKIQTRFGNQTVLIDNECWGIDTPEKDRWFSTGMANLSTNPIYYYNNDPEDPKKMVRNTSYATLGSTFKFKFTAYDHDEGGRCAAPDDYACVANDNWDDGRYQFVLNYENFGDVAPGSWKQVGYTSCDGFYAVRLSYRMQPPKVKSDRILMSRDGNTPETNYCQGGNIVLKINDNSPGVIEHNDIEYIWEYNFDNEEEIDPYNCLEYENWCDPGMPETEECRYCIRYAAYPVWRRATVSNSKTANFTLPYTGNYKFRVMMRNKTSGWVGEYSDATPSVTAYVPAPVLSNLPADADLVLDNADEKDYSSSSIDINHVTCRGASTGVIRIKNLSGYGDYYYTLRKADGTLTLNVNGRSAGTPSASDPVVFPNDAFNNGGLTGLPAGHYLLYVENYDDPAGEVGDEQRLCFNVYNIYIKQPATNVDVSFLAVAKGNGNPYPISCYGASDGTINATGSGGVGPYTYSLTGFNSQGSSGPVNFTGLSASGSYTLTVQDVFSCPSPSMTVQNLAQPELLSIGAPQYEYFGDQNQYNISCNGQTGQVTLFTNGDDVMPRRLQIINGAADNDVANDSDTAIFALNAGTYSVVASYQSGCDTEPVTISLAEPAALDAVVLTRQHASCLPGKGSNDNDGYITLQVSGGIPKATEQYTNYLAIAPQTIVSGTQPIFNGLASGIYEVVIQDAHCSHTVANIEIPVNPDPVAFNKFAQIIPPTCNEYNDGKITVAGKGGFPFSASLYEFSIEGIKKSGQYASTMFDYGITRGTYRLTIEDSKGCWSDTTVQVGEPLPLTAILEFTPNTCRGDRVAQIKADMSGGTGPYSVQWLGAGNQVLKEETVLSSTGVQGLPAGEYVLRMKDSKGCTNREPEWYTISRPITDPETLTLEIFSIEHVKCNGANDGYISLEAKGGWSSYTYSSDNVTFRTVSEFDGLAPGRHQFFVRDALGCTATVVQDVDEPLVLTASEQGVTDAQCYGWSNGSIRLNINGGTTPYYVTAGGLPWQEGNEVTGLKAGTYTVQIHDENGCTQEVASIVGQPKELVLTLVDTTSSTCGSANGEGTVIAIGGVEPYEYRWYNSANELAASGATGTNLLSGRYNVVVRDKNLCETPLPVAVSDVGGAKIGAWEITGATCSYSLDGAIDITITDGTAPLQIEWTNGKQTEDIAGLASGNYQVRIRDSNNCQLFKDFPVPAPEPLDVTIEDSRAPTCFGDSDAFLEVSFAGGNGGYSYQWVNGATGTRLENLKAGDYGIRLTDSRGCEYEEVIRVEETPKLTLGLEDKTICTGQVHRVVIPVEGGVYAWTSTNGFASDQREVSLTQGGIYSVHVVDTKGCIADETFELKTSTDLLNAELLIARKAHAGDTVVAIDISLPLPEGITWQFDVANTQVISEDQNYAYLIFPQPGVYPVGIEISLGDCRDTDIQYITILEERENSGGRATGEPLIKKFDIYPNPNGGKFTIEIELRDLVPARVRMLNLAGNRSFIDHRLEQDTKYEYKAALESIPSGVYVVVLEVAGETAAKRVVIE